MHRMVPTGGTTQTSGVIWADGELIVWGGLSRRPRQRTLSDGVLYRPRDKATTVAPLPRDIASVISAQPAT
jgi:hypothetical protein